MARERVSSCLATFSGQERSQTKGTYREMNTTRSNRRDVYFLPCVGPITFLRYPFPRFYEECSDLRRVVRQLSFYQDEYNVGGNGAEMSLVFFPDAVRHLLRISRILRQPRGNAILIGLAGNARHCYIFSFKSTRGSMRNRITQAVFLDPLVDV